MALISIVVPCYNEEQSLPIFMRETNAILADWVQRDKDISFEFVLVDDGSQDGTLYEIKKLAKAYASDVVNVNYISFSRNFGKESALYAGLEASAGDYVCTMDADMQDPPCLLPRMYQLLLDEECDNVATRRTTRDGEPPIRSMFARLFYKIINRMSDADIVDGARDFRLMTRQMTDAILSLGEYNRFSKGIYGWVGFKTKWVPFVNVERVAGETHWNFFSLLKYALSGIVAFSTAPLSLASLLGVVCCFFSLVYAVFVAAKTFIYGDPVGGWPSLACLVTFLGGVQLLSIGVIGQYLSRTYLEVKRRPIYIVKSTNVKRR